MIIKNKISFYTKYNLRSASVRERFVNYIPYLKKNKFEIEFHPLINDRLFEARILNEKKFSIMLFISIIKRILLILFQKKRLIVIQYELLPYFPPFLESYLNLRKIPYIIDIDDAIFHNYDKSENFFVKLLFKKKFNKIFSNAKLVFAGNEYLLKKSKKLGAKKVHLFPTLVNLKKNFTIEKNQKKKNEFNIVWIGSPSTTKYIDDIKHIIEKISNEHDIKFTIIGSKNSLIRPSKNIKFLDWNLKSEDKWISRCDIGIMPLRNSFWEKGKCGYKLLKYMKNELPILASPVGVNKIILDHGVNGYFINKISEWEKYILKIKNDKKLRIKLGKNGRKKIFKDFSIINYQEKYFNIINNLNI